MFNMHIDGLDRLSVSFLQLEALSDDQIWGIIEPAANTLKDKMVEVIGRLPINVRSGSLIGSIEVRRQQRGYVYALVGPNDSPHPKSSRGIRKPRAQGGKGGSYAGTNAEVGWILEYGSTRIPGRHWMQTAGDECMEELYAQLESGWDQTLQAAGL